LEASNFGLHAIDFTNDLSSMSEVTASCQPSSVPDRHTFVSGQDQILAVPTTIAQTQERSTSEPSTLRESVASSNNSPRTTNSLELSIQGSNQHTDFSATKLVSKQRRSKKYRCDECPTSYDHPKNLREHKQTKHRRIRYTCDYPGCKKSVAQKKNLARHKVAKHGRTITRETP
jgi:hypothetical protein